MLLPNVRKFSSENKTFINMLKEMKETIRRFDEDICLKSNKSDFNLFKEIV